MKKPESVARRLSQASGQEKPVKPRNHGHCRRRAMHRAYIAQMTGELANLANGAPIASLAGLLARAQLEPELWSRQSQ